MLIELSFLVYFQVLSGCFDEAKLKLKLHKFRIVIAMSSRVLSCSCIFVATVGWKATKILV